MLYLTTLVPYEALTLLASPITWVMVVAFGLLLVAAFK